MTRPDNATIVIDYLKANKSNYFCVNCVMAGTDVRPFQQINAIIRPLGATKDFRYMKTTCSSCGADLKCVGYFG